MEQKELEYILKYLYSLQAILEYKIDTKDYATPYAFETRRKEAHDAMIENVILPLLNSDVDSSEVYIRTKMITDNLDKVFKIYDDTPFDLLDDDYCIPWLAKYLRKLFYSTECKYYLEGVTAHIHGIDIPR